MVGIMLERRDYHVKENIFFIIVGRHFINHTFIEYW